MDILGNDFPSLGYWIRRHRKALDLSQIELARRVFCSLSMIKKIELDQRRPSRLMAERLADCLQLRGKDRQAFLSVASSEMSFDRLNPADGPILPDIKHTNIQSYQPSTPFIGLINELAQIDNLINQQHCHLVTLVGPGGIGKTRLALQAASQQLDNFIDGVFFIPLVQVYTSEYISSAILDKLAFTKPGSAEVAVNLINYLRDKNILLVLDDFDQLLDGTELLVDIGRSAHSIYMLVTSRSPLNLRMEQVVEVKGMPINDMSGLVNPNAMDAVQLFIQAARRAGVEVDLISKEITRIIRICRLVDGVPLAIELAASRARTHSIAQIEAGIKGSLDFLTNSMKDIPERHRSIQAAYEFSWNSLSKEEKRVFSTLFIFHSGFTYDAINKIAGAEQNTVESLINKSLLFRVAPDRYDMHELLRRYSETKLNDMAQMKRYRDNHFSYYLELAERMSSSSSEQEAYHLLTNDSEIDNFRAALGWAIENKDQERGLHLAIILEPVWTIHGYLLEGKSWLTRMLSLQGTPAPLLRAKAMIQAANIEQAMGDFAQSIQYCKDSLSLFEELNDKSGIGLSLMIMGIDSYLNGEFVRGSRFLNKSLNTFREIGDEKHQAQALIRIADINMRRGKLDQASVLFKQALLISSKLNEKKEMGFSLGGLGDIFRMKGMYVEAFKYFRKSLLIHWEEHHKSDLPFVMEALAMDYAALEIMDQAVVLWGAADSIREEIHSPLPPSYQQAYAPLIDQIRNRLGEAKFFKEWQKGRNASLDQLITNSINFTDSSATS